MYFYVWAALYYSDLVRGEFGGDFEGNFGGDFWGDFGGDFWILCNNMSGSSNMMEKEIKCISMCEQPCTTVT